MAYGPIEKQHRERVREALLQWEKHEEISSIRTMLGWEGNNYSQFKRTLSIGKRQLTRATKILIAEGYLNAPETFPELDEIIQETSEHLRKLAEHVQRDELPLEVRVDIIDIYGSMLKQLSASLRQNLRAQ